MHVDRVASMTQKDLNAELARKWQNECSKRREYFSRYGINKITFADEDLQNIDACFAVITEHLSRRDHQKVHLPDIINDIKQISVRR